MFGHNPFMWTPISAPQILGAETFAAEEVSNPCDADYLIEPHSAGRFKGFARSSPNEDGSHAGFWSMGWFSDAESIHSYAQSSGKGIKWAYKSDWDAIDPADCVVTSGRSAPSWPFDNDAVIIVKYDNGAKWGYFKPKSASSRGLAGQWFDGTEAEAITQPQATSNYVILDAGVCGWGSFSVTLTPEEILARAQECATPSNCAVSNWGEWSSCSNGTRTRTRTITNPSSNGGTACPSLTETENCANCETSSWSAWSDCGCNGQKSRSRTITQQPSNGGEECPSLSDTSACTPPASCNTTTTGNGGGGGGAVTPCADANRKTNADGSCTNECNEGYEFRDSPNTCVEVLSSDPNDCATANRKKNDDDTCGDCLSGYTEDTYGDCVADATDETEDGPNYLLWGGVAVVAIIGYTLMQ